jgi:hypothetical protein
VPIEMHRLLIKRKGRDSVREFVMHYYSQQDEEGQNEQMYQQFR